MEDLQWACQAVDTRKVKQLLARWPRSRGAPCTPGGSTTAVDIGGADRLEGSTVLHFACAPKKDGVKPGDNLPILRALFVHGAGYFINRPNFAGDTPLMLTCRHNDIACTRVLLQHGADVSSQNAFGDTAMHICCRLGHYALVQQLLPLMVDLPGQPIELRNVMGRTARQLAFNHKTTKVLESPAPVVPPSPGVGTTRLQVRPWGAADERKERLKEAQREERRQRAERDALAAQPRAVFETTSRNSLEPEAKKPRKSVGKRKSSGKSDAEWVGDRVTKKSRTSAKSEEGREEIEERGGGTKRRKSTAKSAARSQSEGGRGRNWEEDHGVPKAAQAGWLPAPAKGRRCESCPVSVCRIPAPVHSLGSNSLP